MARGVDETAGKGGRKQIPEGIALLQHAGNDTTGSIGAVLKGSGSSIAVEAAHGDTEKRTDGEKLIVGLGEACAEFEDDEEHVIDNERPVRISVVIWASVRF